MSLEILKQQLKVEIIEALNLEEMTPSEIEDDAPLFGSGLELDSIDSLELMVLLDRNYGLKVKDAEQGRKIFHSVNSMAEFIQNNQK